MTKKNLSTANLQDIQEALDQLGVILGPLTAVPVYDETRVYEHGAKVQGAMFSDRQTRINEMRDWCSDVLGPKPYGEFYGDRWQFSNDVFWFKNPQDQMMFLLRWR